MKKTLATLSLLAAFAAQAYIINLGPGTEVGESDLYLARIGYGVLAVKYGGFDIIQFVAEKPEGATRWVAQGNAARAYDNSGDGTMDVAIDDFLGAGLAILIFRDGKLESFNRRNGSEAQRGKDVALLKTHLGKVTLPGLWRAQSKGEHEKSKGRWWGDGARLKLWYQNPNSAGALFALVASLAAILAIVSRPWWARAVLAAGALASLYGIMLTGSRGAFVAFFAAVALAAICAGGRSFFRPKGLVRLAVVAVIVAGGVFALMRYDDGRFGAKLFETDSAGNVQRLRAWSAAPEMLAAAPDGWGYEPGRAYCDWFQQTDDSWRFYYLVNSHLTWMVEHGRLWRAGYVAAWFALFAFLFATVRRKTSQVALAVWAAFAVCLWFSTVGQSATLWIAPGLTGVAAVACAVWGMLRTRDVRGVRRVTIAIALAALAGCAAPFAIESAGRVKLAECDIPVVKSGGVVRVGKGEAKCAILRDDTVLAGGIVGAFGHELRDFLAKHPDLGAVLVADTPAELPPRIDLLVAAGKGASKYLAHRRDHVTDGSFCQAARTVFLSPPFPPKAIPYTLVQRTDLEIIAGEYAARLDEGYSADNRAVTIVPGQWLYIPGWMETVLARGKEGGP